jgi:hypothetical protein
VGLQLRLAGARLLRAARYADRRAHRLRRPRAHRGRRRARHARRGGHASPKGVWEYLTAATRACQFILEDLNRADETDEEVCFSYTPLDRTRVFNASLLAGEALASVGAITGPADWGDYALRAARYVARRQRADGSWAYGADSYKLVGQLPHGLRADLARAHTGATARRNLSEDTATRDEIDDAHRARLRLLARAVLSCGRLAEILPSLGAPGRRALGRRGARRARRAARLGAGRD